MKNFKEIRENYWKACREFDENPTCENWKKKWEAEDELKKAWKEMGLD